MKYIIDAPNQDYSYNEILHMLKLRFYDDNLSCEVILDAEQYTETDRKTIEDEVWEFAWNIYSMDLEKYAEIFDVEGCPSNYQEAKAKYEAWKKQNDEIKVGDEVTYTSCGDTVTFIVLGKKKNKYYGFIPNAPDYDDVGEYCDADMLKKTGRHFPEIVELLEKIRGDEE